MDKLETWLTSLSGTVSPRDYQLIDKAAHILRSNVCAGSEFPWYPYRCIRPFIAEKKTVNECIGIWNWDSAFHAIGALRWDVDLAKEQILGFIQFQLEDGMFIDMIGAAGELNDKSSKPPVLAWAAAKIYEADGDKDFVYRVYPKFLKNETFWREQRFYKGMFHYGASITRTPFQQLDRFTRFESGWDDSVRWDNPCSDYWPIDLNCYMVMMYRGMAVLARAIDKEYEAQVFETRAASLIQNINEKLWNYELNCYTDTNRFFGQSSNIQTPASFMPLYIAIAPQDRAAYMADLGADKKKFYPGMPTVSYDDPEYSRKYWRGNTWLNVAYFAAKGLKNYGFMDVAEGIRQTVLSWVERDGECVHENYDSTTGEGLFCKKFSWSCVFVMEFILNF